MTDDLPLPAELALDAEPFSDDDLDLAMRGIEAESVDRWRIDSLGAAEWARRKVADIDRERLAVADQTEEWIRRIRDWAYRQNSRLNAHRRFFADHLIDYLDRLRAEDPKRKTLELPSGVVKSRQTAEAKVKITDEKALIAWATGNAEELLVPSWKLERDRARSVIEAKQTAEGEWVAIYGGERVPGVEVVPPHIDYSVPES